MKLFNSLFILIIVVFFQSCAGQDLKINGVSFVGSREAINTYDIQPVVNINANYAAVMPFGYIRELSHPEITYNMEKQWFGESKSGAKQYISELQKNHIKIMLKPQIWVWRGEFTGNIKMTTEADWKVLESTYSKFILEYAELAENMKVELFCIGTELEQFIAHRPEYWQILIKKIKTIYKGKLTYAANWDEFKRTPFWNDLDFIGIDAYFPVSNSKTPTLNECLTGWEQHKSTVKTMSVNYNKPILFTEFGYRSVDFSGKEPWRSDRSMNVTNLEAQTNTTKALFETFWEEEWFAGGFVWKWFHNYENAGGENDSRFTPQNKPAETVIKHYYGMGNE